MTKKAFDEVVLFARTGLNPRTNFKLGNGNNKYITIKNIHNNRLVVDENTDLIDDEALGLIHKRSQIKEGDILFCSIGRLGDMYIIPNEPKGWDINESVFAFTVDTNLIRQKYFYYLFKNRDTIEYLSKNSSGSTFKSIKMNQLKKMVFELPSLSEQDQIVDTLDLINNIIEKRQNELARLDELIKARFVELFGNILCDTTLPLVQLCTLVDIGSSKRIYADEYVESGVPFYRSKEIRELGIGLKPSVELFIKQERYDEIKKKYGVPKVGDILIAAIGATIGYSWIVDTEKPFYYKDGNLIILSIKDNVNPIFLNHTMGILIEDFKNKGVAGSAQLALTIEKLEKMMVVNPNIELQNQFGEFVLQVDKSKVVVQQALEKTQLLFDKLMQEYFG